MASLFCSSILWDVWTSCFLRIRILLSELQGISSLILGPALFLGLQIGLEDLADDWVFCTEYGVESNVFAREIAKIAESHVHVPRSRAVGLSGPIQPGMLLTRYFSINTINMTLVGVEIVCRELHLIAHLLDPSSCLARGRTGEVPTGSSRSRPTGQKEAWGVQTIVP